MTVALILPDRIVSDSRLVWTKDHTVGKIFRRPDGALFTTAGSSRHTYAFEKAMLAGEEPEYLELLDDEEFQAAVLLPNGTIVVYDENFTPSTVGEPWTAIGSGEDVARSWYMHGHPPELCLERVFEVRTDCGGPVVTVMLHESNTVRRGKSHRK